MHKNIYYTHTGIHNHLNKKENLNNLQSAPHTHEDGWSCFKDGQYVASLGRTWKNWNPMLLEGNSHGTAQQFLKSKEQPTTQQCHSWMDTLKITENTSTKK